MTAKREAELETEVRMLREQVASLERIVEEMTRPWLRLDSSQLVSYAAPQPPLLQYPWPPITWCGTTADIQAVSPSALS